MTSICAGCQALPTSEGMSVLIGLRKRLWTVMLNRLIPHSDLKLLIAIHIKAKWQLEWNESINKLHDIHPSVGKPPQNYTGSRWDEVVLCHCRIGHSWLTHALLLKVEPSPECIGCQSPLTIKHIWLNCVDFMALRQQFYTPNNMHELFTKVKPENILAFLMTADIYNHI